MSLAKCSWVWAGISGPTLHTHSNHCPLMVLIMESYGFRDELKLVAAVAVRSDTKDVRMGHLDSAHLPARTPLN